MNIRTWNAIIKYYQACWTNIDSNKLSRILHFNIVHEYVYQGEIETVEGCKNVCQMYTDKFFKMAIVPSTNITEFKFGSNNDVTYSIIQAHRLDKDSPKYVLKKFKITDVFKIDDKSDEIIKITKIVAEKKILKELGEIKSITHDLICT